MNQDIIRYVTAAAQGDTDSMAKLFTNTLKSSYYLALKLTTNPDEAVGITQNAYARAFCTLSSLKRPDAFEIFMRQTIANVFKEGRTFTFGTSVSDTQAGPLEFLSEDVYEDPIKADAALNAVSDLSDELRSAVVLQYYSGMPVSALAKYLGVGEGVVNNVLETAKSVIAERCGSSEPRADGGKLPVLNRIFKKEAELINIDGAAVRSMFVYIFDKYQTYMKVAGANTGASDGPSIPSKSTAAAQEEEIDFDKFVDEPYERKQPAQNGIIDKVKGFIAGIDFKHLDYKKVGILAAIVLAIIIIIIAAAAHKGKKDDNNANTSVNAVNEITDTDYQWKEGGFEQIESIDYVNENFCCIKVTNSSGEVKYGLMDYQGNVLINPIYDNPFRACGTGRDYGNTGNTSSGKYHVVLAIDNVDYYVTYSNGTAMVTQQKHESHSFDNETLPDDVKYDERDRYFEGYAAAEKNGKWGYIDADGKKVIPYQYEAVNFSTDASSLGTLNKFNCDYCRPVTGGLVAVKNSDGYMGIVSVADKHENETVVPFEYTMILPGKNGVFIAQKNGVWGTILTGNAIITYPSGVKVTIDTEDDITTDASTEDTYYIVSGNGGINVRSDADANATKIGELAAGTRVKGTGTKLAANGNTWLRIEYNGQYGYVAMSLLVPDTQ